MSKLGQWAPSYGPAFDRSIDIKPSDGARYFSKKKRENKHSNKAEQNRRATIEVEHWALEYVVKQSSIATTRLLNSLWSIDRERERISENQIIMQYFQDCKQLRRRTLYYVGFSARTKFPALWLIRFIQILRAEDAKQLSNLLHANQELVHALMSFEQLDMSIDSDSDSDGNPFSDVNVVQNPERGCSDSR